MAKQWEFSWAPSNSILVYGPTGKDAQDYYDTVVMLMGGGLRNANYFRKNYTPKTLRWAKASQTTRTDLWTLPLFQNISFFDKEYNVTSTIHIISRKSTPLSVVEGNELIYEVVLQYRTVE